MRAKLDQFGDCGSRDVVVVGMFDHGIKFDSYKKSDSCPFDTSLRNKKIGNALSEPPWRFPLQPIAWRVRTVAAKFLTANLELNALCRSGKPLHYRLD